MSGLLVHINQKEKIALEIAAKFASVNGPLRFSLGILVIATHRKKRHTYEGFAGHAFTKGIKSVNLLDSRQFC